MKERRQENTSINIGMIRDEEIEKELISRLVTESDLIHEAYGKIRKEDFFESRCQEIYQAMCSLYEEEKKWDLISIRSCFTEPQHYSTYFLRTPQTLGLSQFQLLLESLRRKSIQRQIYNFAHDLTQTTFDCDPGQTIGESLQFFTDTESRLQKASDWKLETLIKKHINLMNDRIEGKSNGIPSGFKDLDYMLGNGFQRKDLIIIGARPSVGKTSFSLTLAYNAAKQKYKVLFITLEMDEQEVFDRLISFETKIPVTTIIRGKVNDDVLIKGYNSLKTLPLSVLHLPKATSGDIHAVASKHKHLYGLDMVIVDYLGYLSDRGDDEVNQLGRISKGLKTTANLLDCVVIAPHQLSRSIEKRSEKKKEVPLLSDLRDSGHIEQDADVVMFLNRDTIGNNSERTVLRIGKHRTGSTGIIDLRFNLLTTKFEL